jgi:hypothetical protein
MTTAYKTTVETLAVNDFGDELRFVTYHDGPHAGKFGVFVKDECGEMQPGGAIHPDEANARMIASKIKDAWVKLGWVK